MGEYSWEAVLSARDNGLTSTINGALGAIDKIDTGFDKFNGSAGKATGAFGEVGSAASKSSGLLSKFKSALGFGSIAGLAMQGVQTLTGGMGDLVSKSATASDAMDKFKSTMNFAGFSNKQINAVSKSMKTYADQTVYELGDVMNTTAQLAANGIPHYQKLTKAAGNLNAVAGGNADTFKSVAMMMTQTAGTGKLTTENWNQLADAIPGASGKLQQAMKKNGAFTGNFRDAMEKGQISAGEFNKAITQLGMTKAAKEAAKSTATFEGAIGNLQAGAVNAFMSIYNAIGKANITGFINGFTNVIAGAAPIISGGIKFISTTIGLLGTYISGNFKNFDKFHKSLVGLVGQDAANKIVPVISSIGGAVGDFVSVVKATAGVLTGGTKNYKEFSQAINMTVPKGVVDVMWGVAKGIKAVISAAADHPKVVATVIGALGGALVLGKVGGILGKIGSNFSLIGKAASGIGGKLLGIGKGAKSVAGAAAPAGSAIKGMGTDTLKAGAGIGIAAAGFGALVLAIASLAKQGTKGIVALAAVTVAITALAGVMALLGPSLTANAVGIGVFGAAVLGVGTGIGIASAGIAALLTAIVALGSNMTAIIPTMTAVGVGFGSMIAGFVTSLATNAPVIAAGVLTIVTTMLTTLTTAIPQFVASGLALLVGIMTGIKNNIGQIVATGLAIAVNFLNGIASNIGSVITAGVNLVVAVVNGIARNLGRIINAGVNLIGSFLIGLAKAMPKITNKAYAAVMAFVSGVGYMIGKALTSGSDLIAHFVTGITKGITGSKKAGKANGDAVKNVLDSINLFKIGAHVISGFVKGITSKVGAAIDAVKGVASKVTGGIRKALGIHSPSRVMRDQVGKYIPLGMAAGITSNIKSVQSAAKQLAAAAVPSVSAGTIGHSLSSANQSLRRGISNAISGDMDVSSHATIEVPVIINGREIARASAKYMKREMTKISHHDSKLIGQMS